MVNPHKKTNCDRNYKNFAGAPKIKKSKKIPTYVDLFSGAGGASLGFQMGGFKNIFSVDCDRNSCETYRQNMSHHVLVEDKIENLTKQDIKTMIKGKNVDVVIGGTPCQGFSMAGNIGRQFLDDPRNYLFKEFARVISILTPKFFIMENVARLYTHNHGNTRRQIIQHLTDLGYDVDCEIINTKDYGISQNRRRVLIIGNRLGLENKFPKSVENGSANIKSVISNLPRLSSGMSSKIPNHIAMNHSKQMLKKMSFISDGGDRYDIPKRFRPHSGDVRKYIRYKSDQPSVCVTGDMRKIFHYSQNRALTVRELARIQSFPDDFIFYGTSLSQQQQVGNAIPPKLAHLLSKTLKQQLMASSSCK